MLVHTSGWKHVRNILNRDRGAENARCTLHACAANGALASCLNLRSRHSHKSVYYRCYEWWAKIYWTDKGCMPTWCCVRSTVALYNVAPIVGKDGCEERLHNVNVHSQLFGRSRIAADAAAICFVCTAPSRHPTGATNYGGAGKHERKREPRLYLLNRTAVCRGCQAAPLNRTAGCSTLWTGSDGAGESNRPRFRFSRSTWPLALGWCAEISVC